MKTFVTLHKNAIGLFILFSLITISVWGQQVINTTLQHDGKTRAYRLYIPQSYDPNVSSPLILNFHGFSNNIDIQYDRSSFQQLAEQNQFIFVTPQGINNGWAINNFFGGFEDDLGFVDALIDKIQEDYSINEKRVYATGYSNGGYFSYRLACELSSRIAAVASVAGSMTASWINNGQCQPNHPTAVLQITGTNDGTIPISGGGLGKSIQDVMEYWAAYNNADSSPDTINLGSGTTRYIWDNGDNGVTAEFIEVGGKGHSWEGGNVNTSQEVWNFFSRFDIDGAIDGIPAPVPPVEGNVCLDGIATFPYLESFEGTNLAGWTNADQNDVNWSLLSSTTPSTGTGPSSAANGATYVYVEASTNGVGYPNKSAILNTPCFDLTSSNAATFSFQYHMLGNAVGNLTLEASTNNGNTWTPVFSRSGSQGDNWLTANINMNNYVGSGVQLRFNAVTGASWQGDIAIDSVAMTINNSNNALIAAKNIPEEEKNISIKPLSVSIYPNPIVNEQFLKVSVTNTKDVMSAYQIINMAGQTKSNGLLNANTTLDVSKLDKGVYLLQISNNKSIITKKFVVK